MKRTLWRAGQFFEASFGESASTRYMGLAHNLKTSAFRVRSCFDTDGAFGAAKRIIAGKGKASGANYGEAFVDRVWESLNS
ncbi:MAG: hypothetical protein K9M08_04710 [Pirellula sp.]|nr:hypothetical protein [Pirellula sp.]